RDLTVTGVQTCALPISLAGARLTRPLGIIHRKQPLSAAARGFIDLLCEREEAARPRGARVNGVHPASRTTKAHHGRNGTARAPKIGRASCRERAESEAG